MLKFLKRSSAFIFLTCSLVTSSALAGTQMGTITQLLIRTDGLVFFYLTGVASGRPACATVTYWMIKAEDSAVGKRMVAALLASKLSGQTISVSGNGTCSRWPDGEDVDLISLVTL
ncbi:MULTISPECIES: hypothetical protein [unclassified Janthinobacterium]|uniref:hypothetical protein n=1 Tax=unclassified Janthinobacterium TaxID=2610881 RepID=UPI0018DEEA37|nr:MULTISPECIES: hypothetical protein [unclassified Janthinobacterium]MEC5159361.1 hypothetical protein [Janthinobacterium sp. CG_S6]